jgi:hypothetical protein
LQMVYNHTLSLTHSLSPSIHPTTTPPRCQPSFFSIKQRSLFSVKQRYSFPIKLHVNNILSSFYRALPFSPLQILQLTLRANF